MTRSKHNNSIAIDGIFSPKQKQEFKKWINETWFRVYKIHEGKKRYLVITQLSLDDLIFRYTFSYKKEEASVISNWEIRDIGIIDENFIKEYKGKLKKLGFNE